MVPVWDLVGVCVCALLFFCRGGGERGGSFRIESLGVVQDPTMERSCDSCAVSASMSAELAAARTPEQ